MVEAPGQPLTWTSVMIKLFYINFAALHHKQWMSGSAEAYALKNVRHFARVGGAGTLFFVNPATVEMRPEFS